MAFKIQWTEDLIRNGLERFKTEHGRYPTAREFDTTDYLPTARQIQRKYGGLPTFRQKFTIGGTENFTRGHIRAAAAAKAYSRAYQYEEEFYNYLIGQVAEELVHEQKRIRPGNIACDFFIYNKNSKERSLIIDVFYAESLYNLAGIVNIKVRRYREVSYRTFFIAAGDVIVQDEIDKLMSNKKGKLPKHIQVCSEQWFKQHLEVFLK